jgi:RNA polymerase sigma-70 factor (ECF subfamily)
MAAPSDQLLALMQAGDLLALDRLAREYGHTLLAVARRACHRSADAEDAVQQALLLATSAMTGIRGDGSPLAWLSTLVSRSCFRMNEQAARVDAVAEASCTCDDPAVLAERGELAERLGEALMALSRTDRLVFVLSVEGFTSVEIARRFELSHDAVRSRLKRARKHLRRAVEAPDTLQPAPRTPGVNPPEGVHRHDDEQPRRAAPRHR